MTREEGRRKRGEEKEAAGKWLLQALALILRHLGEWIGAITLGGCCVEGSIQSLSYSNLVNSKALFVRIVWNTRGSQQAP